MRERRADAGAGEALVARPGARGAARPRGHLHVHALDQGAEARVLRRGAGCGRSIGISLTTRPGLVEKISRRSHICTASSMLWVTSSTALIGSCPSPHSSRKSRAQGLGGQDVERRERLVHEQDVGVHDQRAREADALAHAAGELARVGGLEAVEADEVDGLAASACASPAAGTPRASSPSCTFSSTVSQGNSAKLWNTMAMPCAGADDRLAEIVDRRRRRADPARRSSAAASTCPSRSGRAGRRSPRAAASG